MPSEGFHAFSTSDLALFMPPKTFREIIRQYFEEHVAFFSPRRTGPASYLIEAISDSDFNIRNLKSGKTTTCLFEVAAQAIEKLHQHGNLAVEELSDSPAITSAILQSAECGLSFLRQQVYDLSDHDEACDTFCDLLARMRVSKQGDTLRLYKPVIMWCIFDALNCGDLTENRILFDWLVPRFLQKFKALGISANEQNAAEAFYHLTSETFWLLAYASPDQILDKTPLVSQVRRSISHAILKETFWRVLSDPERLRRLELVIERHWFHRMLQKPDRTIEINLEILDKAVGQTIRPFLVDLDQLNVSKSEGYHHQKIIPSVGPYLSHESLDKSCGDSLLAALKRNVNLLSPQEVMAGREFIASADPVQLRERALDLIYGSDTLLERVGRFLAWSSVKETSSGKRSGLNATVVSYLLAMSDPTRYAFCKPLVYKAAVEALLGSEPETALSAAERIIQASEFYEAVLKLFQQRYKLPFTDLHHVHIAFYVMAYPPEGFTGWKDLLQNVAAGKIAMTDDLNVILYGPPGTGKTYDTIRRAVEICDGESPLTREKLVERFKQLREAERIAFVTFHQSYGYEDFVEGVRPVLQSPSQGGQSESSGDIQYECHTGIFKYLCSLAKGQPHLEPGGEDIDLSKTAIWKMSLGDTQVREDSEIYDECISNNYVLLGYGKGLNFDGCDSKEAIRKKLEEHDAQTEANDFSIQAIDLFKLRMKIGDLIVISDGNRRFRAIAKVTGNYEFLNRDFYPQMRRVEWLTVLDESVPREAIYEKSFSQMTIYQLKKQYIRLEALRDRISPPKDGPRNYVMIVDEINRGNISKILGELITLLEPDKRLGAENELKVILPYSGDHFGVPSNVFLIGTMNTADRSIAFMDVALRRRFRFHEIMPDPELLRKVGNNGVLEDISLPDLLQTLNERIELLYDRDHQIGHAFFMSVSSLVDLREVFLGKVIPLLQEYFYGDWGKICSILGCGFDSDNSAPQTCKYPIIKADRLKSSRLLGSGIDIIDDKIRCCVNPAFSRASSKEDLLPFFKSFSFEAE